MNVIDELYVKHPKPTIGSDNDDPEAVRLRSEPPIDPADDLNETPYPQTSHPNIMPPTEFMAQEMYAR